MKPETTLKDEHAKECMDCEVKEFTIAVTGRVYPKSKSYRIRAQNKKQAKKQALELFENDFGDKFDLVKILAAWQNKEKEEQDG